MTKQMLINWLTAQLMLHIWNPDLIKHINKNRMLYYKTNGIVLHDRELNRKD
jgi:hypothetical protein